MSICNRGDDKDRELAARMDEEEGLTFSISYGVSEESVGHVAPVVSH